MRGFSFATVAVVLIAVSTLVAAPSSTQDIAFAVPGEGLISLGVFNKAGKLVRILHALDGEEAFRIGLNGYITRWDGLDSAGQKVPAGRYFVRGYLVGDVLVEGVAFHFNDWVSSGETPAPRRIEDFALLQGGDVLLVGFTAPGQGLCARYSHDRGFLWSREFPNPSAASPLLAATDRAAVIHSSEGWHIYSLEDGSEMPNAQLPASAQPRSLAGAGGRICFSENATVTFVVLDGSPPPAQVSAPFVWDALSASGNDLAGISEGTVWLAAAGSEFAKLPIPAMAESLSFGEGRTLWFTGKSMDPAATPVVAQTNREGVILRALVPDAADPQPVRVRASRMSDVFAVLEEASGLQRFRVLSRNPEGGWSIEWERSIRDAPEFGFVDGQVMPQATSTQQPDSFRVRLEENPLTGEHQEITLQARSGAYGVRLETLDGLPVVSVSHNSRIRRVVTQRGTTPDSLRLLQGGEASVEEFLIQDLRHITPLSAGSLEVGK